MSECTARERHERRKDAHDSIIAERKAAFVTDGSKPHEAERKAKDMQAPIMRRIEAEG